MKTTSFDLSILHENLPVFVIYYNIMHYSILLKFLYNKKGNCPVD